MCVLKLHLSTLITFKIFPLKKRRKALKKQTNTTKILTYRILLFSVIHCVSKGFLKTYGAYHLFFHYNSLFQKNQEIKEVYRHILHENEKALLHHRLQPAYVCQTKID